MTSFHRIVPVSFLVCVTIIGSMHGQTLDLDVAFRPLDSLGSKLDSRETPIFSVV